MTKWVEHRPQTSRGWWGLCLDLGRYSHTPVCVLWHLATKPSWVLRCELARRPSAPMELIQQLAHDDNPIVRHTARQRLENHYELLTDLTLRRLGYYTEKLS